MIPTDPERRMDARLPHECVVKVKTLDGTLFHTGRLVNFSRSGAYLETDALLEPGAEVFLAIEDSPFEGADAGAFDVWYAVVKHRCEVDSSFRSGCGVQLTGRLGSALFTSNGRAAG